MQNLIPVDIKFLEIRIRKNTFLQRSYDEINPDMSPTDWVRKDGSKFPKNSQMLIHRLANDLPQPRLGSGLLGFVLSTYFLEPTQIS
jgi:hypothetical protein